MKKNFIDYRDYKELEDGFEIEGKGVFKYYGMGQVLINDNIKSFEIYKKDGKYYIMTNFNSWATEIYDFELKEIDYKWCKNSICTGYFWVLKKGC